jgi:hypothetical protein
MVTFVDGKPDKKGYRKYKIKTVKGPDDYKLPKQDQHLGYLSYQMLQFLSVFECPFFHQVLQ